MAWGKNGTPTTLGSAADVLTISDLNSNIFNMFMVHGFGDAAGVRNTGNDITFNSNTNTVYAVRYSLGGTADSTVESQAEIYTRGNRDYGFFEISYVGAVIGEEKLMILFHVNESNSGAGTAPVRSEIYAKFVPSPDAPLTRIDYDESDEDGTTSYDTNSNLSALGTD